jgi:trimethylamine--corrinoid protein Co-methyltransferase
LGEAAGSWRGAFKLLSERQLDRIHTGTLDVLENTGVRFTNAYVQSQWRQAGFPLDETGLVRLPPHVVEDAIHRTPRRYTRLGKTRNLDIHMGDGGLYVGVGSLPLYVVEWTGTEFIRRDATRQDMVRFAYLGDACPHLAIGNGQVKPKDVPDSVVHAIWNQNAVKNIAKPTCCWYALDIQTAQDTLAILRAAAGGDQTLRQAKSWAITVVREAPLCFGDSAIGLVEMAKAGVPVEIMPTPFPGSMTPVTLAGTIVQFNAEILAALVLAQTLNPGTPVNYCTYSGVMDMRMAAHSFGAPEIALYNAAAAQLSNWYGIPNNLVTGISDSKVPDAQAAYEKTLTTLLPCLAGADSTSLIGGELDFGLSASYEQLVIDDEIADQILRLLRGFEINEETLALDVIGQVGPGGHYLQTDHTLRHFRQELSLPAVADRHSWDSWAANGKKDTFTRARERVEDLLAAHRPIPLAEDRARAVDDIVREICLREGVEYESVAV